jgi:hypothetical protein
LKLFSRRISPRISRPYAKRLQRVRPAEDNPAIPVINLLNAVCWAIAVLGTRSCQRLGLNKIAFGKPAGFMAENDLHVPVASHRIWFLSESIERSLGRFVTIAASDPVRARHINAVTMLNAQRATSKYAAAHQHRPRIAKIASMKKALNPVRYPVGIGLVNVPIARSALDASDFKGFNYVRPPPSRSKFEVKQVAPGFLWPQDLETRFAPAIIHKIKDGMSGAKVVIGTQVFKPFFR